MDPVGLKTLRGVTYSEMGQFIVNFQPQLAVFVVVGHDLIRKKGQGRITDSRQKTNQRMIREKIDSSIDTQEIKKDK